MTRIALFPCSLSFLFLVLIGFTSCNDDKGALPPVVPESEVYTLTQRFIDGRLSIYGRWDFVDHYMAWQGFYVPDFHYLELSPIRQFRVIRNDSVIISGSYNYAETNFGVAAAIEFVFNDTEISGTTTFLNFDACQWLFFEPDANFIRMTDQWFDGNERVFKKVE